MRDRFEKIAIDACESTVQYALRCDSSTIDLVLTDENKECF